MALSHPPHASQGAHAQVIPYQFCVCFLSGCVGGSGDAGDTLKLLFACFVSPVGFNGNLSPPDLFYIFSSANGRPLSPVQNWWA